MNRSERDEAEWLDPDNWRGGWLGFYVAPRDSRVWVPKKLPGMGWTLNFAHPQSWLWLLALLASPLVVVIVLAVFLR